MHVDPPAQGVQGNEGMHVVCGGHRDAIDLSLHLREHPAGILKPTGFLVFMARSFHPGPVHIAHPHDVHLSVGPHAGEVGPPLALRADRRQLDAGIEVLTSDHGGKAQRSHPDCLQPAAPLHKPEHGASEAVLADRRADFGDGNGWNRRVELARVQQSQSFINYQQPNHHQGAVPTWSVTEYESSPPIAAESN